MKTRLLPSLALAAVLALSACAGGEPAAPPPPATPTAGTTATQPPTGEPSPLPPQTAEPSPDAPTTPPAGAVTAANLPEASDLQWNDAATWRAGETSTGGGTEQLSVCQQNRLESLGANALQVRRFTLSGGAGHGVAIAMSFDNRELADQAYATVQEWVADCRQVLTAQQRVGGRQTIDPTPVTVPVPGRAQVTEWAYSTAADAGEFESQGLAQNGDRLALLVMRVEGQDNNWDLEPGGPVGEVHPMIRTLPAVAAKLTR